ncbi:uncharacterized protein LOC127729400 [Mytilus californianus]|uniref:uncharacterized protein LOC127729400 n=1 Tax=Mytilus californianus TaxID=6549 RepID=UPI002248434B|nr:uncharacterized protein LOC127729400 [Mytilus californianus]
MVLYQRVPYQQVRDNKTEKYQSTKSMCDLKDYANDFTFLIELKSYLKEYAETNASKNVEDGINKGIYSKLVDGRSIRLVLPHGYHVLRSVSLESDINFVGFIGFNKPLEQVSETLRDKVWDIDGKLVEEFSNHEDIIAYVSAERSIGGEWGNLVLLKSFDAIEKWRDCPVHHTAVSEIAPLYYTRIRIHRGRIQNGKLIADQTLFLDYGITPTNRCVQVWIK